MFHIFFQVVTDIYKLYIKDLVTDSTVTVGFFIGCITLIGYTTAHKTMALDKTVILRT